jgi:DoxX-like family
MTIFAALFLTFDGVIKLLTLQPVVESFAQLGYPISAAIALGAIELICLAIYLIPRTSVLGAILLTGYLGGAIATHVRIGSPLFSHTLFPIYIGLLIWGGIYLRNAKLRSLIPLSTGAH